MKDQTNLLRWLDLSWFAPVPLSIGLAIWSVITRPDPETAGSLLLMQMAFMAAAATVPAGLAASHSQVWRRRLAPQSFVEAVHRVWRQQTLALLALGLIGPTAVAVRALGMDATSLACWALALPVLGTAVGMLASWAWAGSLAPATLTLWPGMAGAALLLWLDRAAWVMATGPAVAGLVAAVLLMGWVWGAARQLRQRWSGMAPLLARWRQRKLSGMKRWQWAPLAFADGHASLPAGPPLRWVGTHLPFFLFLAPVKAVFLAELTGEDYLRFGAYICFMVAMTSGNLLIRDDHWRLRLAPVKLTQSTRFALMVAASTAPIAVPILGLLGLTLWLDRAALNNIWSAGYAVTDPLLCVAFAACVRGVSNRRLVVTLASLTLMLAASGTLGWLWWQGYTLERGAAFLSVEAAVTLLLLAVAARQWRGQPLRGYGQWAPQRDDS